MAAATGGWTCSSSPAASASTQPRCASGPGQRLAFLGVAIDSCRNDTVHRDGDITAAGTTVRTLVITAREDLQIAREARRLLRDHGRSARASALALSRPRPRPRA